MTIDTSKYTAHNRPGKFEGEGPETEYFYECMLDGDGEDLQSEESLVLAALFQISAEEATAFALFCGDWFLLREDENGFVYGSTHKTREAAEARFAGWVS